MDEEKAAGGERDKTKAKRRALIVILAILIAAAIAIPLTMINYSDVHDLIVGANKKDILYCAADYNEDIWANEDYIGSKTDKSVKAEGSGIAFDRSFYDQSSALATFEALSALPDGGEVLGRYFTFLISGLDRTGKEDFAALFTSGFTRALPARFPAQKLCHIELLCRGYDPETGLYEWRVYFEVMNNDGTVVDYFENRDNGSARFFIAGNSGNFRIARIETVYRMN